MTQKLVFMHLSDIHFQDRISGGPFDVDKDLRDELESDAVRVKVQLGKVDAILVTGDIAFSGKKDEYDTAHQWLGLLSGKLDCETSNVWVVPGNHDVDRTYFKKDGPLSDIHSAFRALENQAHIDVKLKHYLEDQVYKQIMFAPVERYNEFAAKFGCDFHATKPYCWESDFFKLNDGSQFQLRGLNSTIISDNTDNDKANKLVLGSMQTTLTRVSGLEYLTLCHHPPQWLIDGDNVESKLNKRARIQLFGHKHSQTATQIDETIRLTAGAVHPDRREGQWLPRYNFLEIWVTKEDNNRYLSVNVYSRVWDGDMFAPEVKSGKDFRGFKLKLPAWEGKANQTESKPGRVGGGGETATERKYPSTEMNVNPNRILAYRFLSLPFHKRMQIAVTLELIEDNDNELSDRELFEAVFRRADRRFLLGALWDLTQKAHSDSKYDKNPYLT